MLESEIGLDSTAETTVDNTLYGADGGEKVGTEGMFAAIESRAVP